MIAKPLDIHLYPLVAPAKALVASAKALVAPAKALVAPANEQSIVSNIFKS